MSIVCVIATITTKDGKRDEALKNFNENRANVLNESGCIEYFATIDLEDAGHVQTKIGQNTFVILEKWASFDDLRNHIGAPHMAVYSEKMKSLLVSRVINVLSEVDK
jgi:quinol monooxygenase YgiN